MTLQKQQRSYIQEFAAVAGVSAPRSHARCGGPLVLRAPLAAALGGPDGSAHGEEAWPGLKQRLSVVGQAR
eukprot:CAMPEP_0183579882 /NCGR_PEP_ID=MMETSP0371-20130417/144685_1 /TAXON_ID=268820 /ORGANISM="Peridinium aciculiferum, Strain PAER-2" /LENGTH=70 /DNA_ID=CAMNT_0025790425 /DNA_START=17 /DNA_END=225 /DNA_ORIENTATION=-